MLFSKSFGYAVRTVLFIASVKNEKRNVQLEEITKSLNLPKQFIGRILKNLVKEGVLISIKGPHGGFSIHEKSLQLSLMKLLEITDGNSLENCVLKKTKCNPANLCPVHDQFSKIREELVLVMTHTTIGEIIKGDRADFVRSLSEVNGKGKK